MTDAVNVAGTANMTDTANIANTANMTYTANIGDTANIEDIAYLADLTNIEDNTNSMDTTVCSVRDHKGMGCNVALIKCTWAQEKPKRGWDFGREGTGGQMGNRGS